MPDHNHFTRDIKPYGSCTGCDEYHDKTGGRSHVGVFGTLNDHFFYVDKEDDWEVRCSCGWVSDPHQNWSPGDDSWSKWCAHMDEVFSDDD